jgi:hypothetical protein
VKAASAAQSSWGSLPLSALPQMPLPVPLSFKSAAHAWQVPWQGSLQQKPSTQLPEMHWLPAVQLSPLGWSGLQRESEASHQALCMQPLSLEQLEAHDGALPLQR